VASCNVWVGEKKKAKGKNNYPLDAVVENKKRGNLAIELAFGEPKVGILFEAKGTGFRGGREAEKETQLVRRKK